MLDKMTPYVGKFRKGDCLVIKTGEGLCAAYESFTDFPHRDVYWIPSEETIEITRRKKLVVESCYYFHGGYPIYVLVFEKDGQEYECKICEIFLQKQGETFNIKVTPTLYIALGGTGAEIALRLRRRILTNAWGYDDKQVSLNSLDEFPLAQFIYFDLDRGSTDVKKNSDHLANSVAFLESERITQSNFYLDPYYYSEQSCHRNPNIDSWLPVKPEWIKEWINLAEERANNHSPTVQPRFFSRMVFFNEYRRLMHMIQDKLNSLLVGVSNRASLNRIGLDTESGNIRVVVLASTAGGAGSGAFIDMGYFAKQLVKKATIGNCMVDLMLMLPGGYSGHDKARCEAITYAALMELETCMRPGPGFVKGWNSDEFADLPDKPYDNVFLIDTINLAEKTSEVSDIFDMMADNLFADFSSSEFSSQKRSVSVNQYQHAICPFTLPVSAEKFGGMKMNFSKAYSSCGLAAIDTGLETLRHEIAREQVGMMLKIFFGVLSESGEERQRIDPTQDEALSLLHKHVYCDMDKFRLSYRFNLDAAHNMEGLEFSIPKLVDQLLHDDDKQMLSHLHNHINKEIDEISTLTEKDQQLERIEKLVSELVSDLGFMDVKGLPGEIQIRRQFVLQNMVNENSDLLKSFWSVIDNKENGGIDYAVLLIERIKTCIENVIRNLETSQKRFSELFSRLKRDEIPFLRDQIIQEKGGLFGLNKTRKTEERLRLMGEAMRWFVEARLRETACGEAVTLLKGVSLLLGEHRGMDDRTYLKRWSEGSVADKLAGYKNLVLDIIAGLSAKTDRARGGMESGTPIISGIKSSTIELEAVRNLSPRVAMEMAQSVFVKLGGSRDALERLMNNQSSAEIIGQLHNLALSRLPVIGRGDENPLLKALEALDSTERRDIFQNCLESAMPWIDAKTEGFWTVNSSQYVCLVGVDGAQIFAQRFGDEFRSALPVSSGMIPNQIQFFESGSPDKLTCYIELSGLPITALTQLPQWRQSYVEENKKIPLHIHKDRSLFVHPLAPTAATLDRLAEHFRLFIQGIVLGILKQRRNDSGSLEYCFTVSCEELSVGNERLIRLDGFEDEVQSVLQKLVANALDQLKSSAQHVSLVALYDFFAQYVYPPAIMRDCYGMDSLQESFPHVMCHKLVEEALKSLVDKYPDEDTDLIVRLKNKDLLENLGTIDLWTVEIEGSDSDVYEYEVGRAHQPKRQLKSEFYQPGWLERQVYNTGTVSDGKRCTGCGYGLEGTPNFCPECGMRQTFQPVASPPPLP